MQMKTIDTLYLTILPIVGTAVAYIFEIGFAVFHGIPSYFIELNISQFVGSAVIGLLCLWIFHLYLSFGLALIYSWDNLIFYIIGRGLVYAAPIILLIPMAKIGEHLWMLFIIMFCLSVILDLISCISPKSNSQTYLQYLRNKNRNTTISADDIESIIDQPQEMLGRSLGIILLAFMYGYGYASWANSNDLLKSDPTKALVVVYGDKWFFRSSNEIAQPRSMSNGQLLVLSGDVVKNVTLEFQNKAKLNYWERI